MTAPASSRRHRRRTRSRRPTPACGVARTVQGGKPSNLHGTRLPGPPGHSDLSGGRNARFARVSWRTGHSLHVEDQPSTPSLALRLGAGRQRTDQAGVEPAGRIPSTNGGERPSRIGARSPSAHRAAFRCSTVAIRHPEQFPAWLPGTSASPGSRRIRPHAPRRQRRGCARRCPPSDTGSQRFGGS